MGTATTLDEIAPEHGVLHLLQPVLALAVTLLVSKASSNDEESALSDIEAGTAENHATSDTIEAWLKGYAFDRCGLAQAERPRMVELRRVTLQNLDRKRSLLVNLEALRRVSESSERTRAVLEASCSAVARSISLGERVIDVLELEIDSHDMRLLKAKPFVGVRLDDVRELLELDD